MAQEVLESNNSDSIESEDNENRENKSKIKIAYLAPRYHPFKGGAETNLLAMSTRMVDAGHNVVVLTTDFKFRDLKPPKVEKYNGVLIKRVKAFIERPAYLCFAPGLLRHLLASNAQVIHMSGFGFSWFEFCLILKKLIHPKTRLINTPHGPFMAFEEDSEGSIRKLSRKIYTRILRLFLNKLYDRIIAVVPSQKEWLTKEYGINEDKIIVVPNGIDKGYIESELKEHREDEEVLITFLGRFERYKGMHDVLYAMAKLRRQKRPLPKFKFLMMGRQAPYANTLKSIVEKEKLENYVEFWFSPTDEERDEILYKQSQIFILPSKWEATGIVLFEAMAKGNVVISTLQNEAVDLIVKPGETGYSYSYGDEDKLAEILRTLLEDFELRQNIRRNNLQYVKKFTWNSVFPKYENMVKQLAGLKSLDEKKAK